METTTTMITNMIDTLWSILETGELLFFIGSKEDKWS